MNLIKGEDVRALGSVGKGESKRKTHEFEKNNSQKLWGKLLTDKENTENNMNSESIS